MGGDQLGMLCEICPEEFEIGEKLDGADQIIRDIKITSDEKKLITCGDDKTLRIWDIES